MLEQNAIRKKINIDLYSLNSRLSHRNSTLKKLKTTTYGNGANMAMVRAK